LSRAYSKLCPTSAKIALIGIVKRQNLSNFWLALLIFGPAACFKQGISILEGANMQKQVQSVKLNYADCLEKLGKVKEAAELRKHK
jgi:hypothetical protein